MRTLLPWLLVVAAPAAAEPAHDTPTDAASIDITELTISGGGGVDPTIMRHAFEDTVVVAQRCYDSAKSRPAKLSATVTLKFRIDDRGAVAKAAAVGLPSMNSCIATAIKALVFDAPSKGALDVTEKLAFSTPRTALRTAGILGSTTDPQGGGFASLTGTGDISGGFDDTEIYGGLLSSEPGKPARRTVPTVSIGQPTAQGDLDKAIIRRYIKRNIRKIQYCYEKQLASKPGLAGTVQVQFTIGGDGRVSSSSGSGVDATVASCVAEVIQNIEFPRPKTDGVVNVNYPFVFHPGSDDKQP